MLLCCMWWTVVIYYYLVVPKKKESDHIPPISASLPCLFVKSRIGFKILLLAHKVIISERPHSTILSQSSTSL